MYDSIRNWVLASAILFGNITSITRLSMRMYDSIRNWVLASAIFLAPSLFSPEIGMLWECMIQYEIGYLCLTLLQALSSA
jgi:hypothetical protein